MHQVQRLPRSHAVCLVFCTDIKKVSRACVCVRARARARACLCVIFIYTSATQCVSCAPLSLSLSLSTRSGKYRKGMILARPLYQGVRGSVWDPDPSKERVGDWGRPASVWSLLCVAETRDTRPNGEWGYSTRRQCWATSAQRRCHPEEALYLPTFSQLLDCQ